MCKMCGLEYENIHSHSMYSNVQTPDSIITKEDIAIRAKELGHKTLSLVEHGYFSNIFEVYPLAEKYDLNIIFGSEVYFVKDRFEKDRTNAHLLIMAKNEEGRKELTGIISEANKSGFYYRPRIDEELLYSLNPENVIVTTACLASPIRLYEDYAEEFITKSKEHFGDNFFLEVQPHTMKDQVDFNKKLQEYRTEFDVPFILGIDTHYIYPEDSVDRDLFLRGKNMIYPEETGMIIDYPTTEDIIDRFSKQNVLTEEEIREAFNNTLIAREFEPVKLNREIKMPSIHPDKTHEEKVDILKSKISNAWVEDRKHIDKEDWPEYLEAIRFETEIIKDTMMEDYFLLNEKIIDKAVTDYGGVLTQTGRGSAPSFYVNKLLGFTEVDRLEAPIELYPTRFMSKSRILETKSLPDIDFNTADPEPFMKASRDILGEDNVYLMVAYGTMRESEAFRNYCRALDLDIKDFNPVGKDLDSHRNHSYWGPIIKESEMFIGVIDSWSPHPCATVILDESVSEELGVMKVGDVFVALIDSDNSDRYKYLKNDFLTVTVWDIISQTYDVIGQPIDDVRTLVEKTKDDDKVWDLYKEGLVSTLNQAGTPSGKPQVIQYAPRNIRELSGWVSAIRPAFSSMKDYFLNRREFKYDIPELDKLLESSDNFILYQENIMSVLQYVGFEEDATYGLLKAIAKKQEGIIEPIHDKFMNGFIEKTGSEENALRVWQIIEDAVDYGFNASHAYSVALDSLYGAYLKANYPIEYFSVVLNIYQNDTAKASEIEAELDSFGIKVGPVRFGKSRSDYTPDPTTNTIYKGVSSIKYLSRKASESLYQLSQEEEYVKGEKQLIDLLIDIIERTSANSRQTEILINLGYFSKYAQPELMLNVWQTMNGKGFPQIVDKKYEDGRKYPLLYSKNHIDKTKEKRRQNLIEYIELLEANPPAERTVYERIQYEREFIGRSTLTFPEVSNAYVLVTDLNLRYTPVVELYQLNNGKTHTVKIKKNKFYDANDNPLVMRGNIIKILKSHEEYGMKKVDGKWVKNESVIWRFIDQMAMVTS